MAAAYTYLDHNATSPMRPAALDAMVEALRAGDNPSSIHRPGRAARARIDRARKQVAGLVGAGRTLSDFRRMCVHVGVPVRDSLKVAGVNRIGIHLADLPDPSPPEPQDAPVGG